MSLTSPAIRLLRLLPVLSSTITLMFAVDEHIFLGTWMHPTLIPLSNTHLPTWFAKWGRRGRWPIILGYPANYIISILNFLIARENLVASGAEKWYLMGFLFSLGHMLFAKKAVRLLAEIKNDIPKGNSTYSMGVWLRMNWMRALMTDFPAWVCFIVGLLTVL